MGRVHNEMFERRSGDGAKRAALYRVVFQTGDSTTELSFEGSMGIGSDDAPDGSVDIGSNEAPLGCGHGNVQLSYLLLDELDLWDDTAALAPWRAEARRQSPRSLIRSGATSWGQPDVIFTPNQA